MEEKTSKQNQKIRKKRKQFQNIFCAKAVCTNFCIPMNHVCESYRPSLSSLKVITIFIFFSTGKS